MKIILVVILTLILLSSFAYADTVILKAFKTKNKLWYYDGLFIEPNIIIINGYDSKYRYEQTLRHELQHYYCYKLFKNIDIDHKRCFVKGDI